jgi:hypothetical protein
VAELLPSYVRPQQQNTNNNKMVELMPAYSASTVRHQQHMSELPPRQLQAQQQQQQKWQNFFPAARSHNDKNSSKGSLQQQQ